MKILRFTLRGKTAFFKKPDVNTYCCFTYGQIHKVALLGIFGAILGYRGYAQCNWSREKNKELKEQLPEFYERLEHLRVSIIPNRKHGYIPKKIQIFNNTVGYASQEQGGNLITKEQWLEQPSWDICVLLESEEGELLARKMLTSKCVYIPYLGKNDHLADILNVHLEEAVLCKEDVLRISSLFLADSLKRLELDEDELEELDAFAEYKYQESLPAALHPKSNLYLQKMFVCTDEMVRSSGTEIYRSGHQNIVFI